MDLPVIDLTAYLAVAEGDPSNLTEKLGPEVSGWCKEVSRVLRETGALLVKDPRCTVEDNDRFIDMMERYFESPAEFKRRQERPGLHYQVGVTPEGVEVPRSLVDEEMQEKLRAMPKEFQPATPEGPDRKWRYMWRVGPRPSDTRFQELNSEPVIPEGFPDWKNTMDSWGYKMISAIEVVAEMAAIGFGLPKDAFTSLMKQIEWLTAGECIAGMHEVVVTNRTIEAIKLATEQNRSLWRVSSTLFSHVASDAVLKPLGHFAESPLASKYPSMCAGEFVEQELAVINLKGNKGEP
uniref:Non-haem dioxygenase N-terminal domain-containing protein n=1 Tax=Fagus sylvatica TaxID=28930 RepID=A0A2N9GV49_FAGSY